MRRLIAFIVIVLACLCVPARPAHAQRVFLEWLERLSGPGPMKGIGVHVDFACYGFKKRFAEFPDPSAEEIERAKKLEPPERQPQFYWSLGCGRSARNVTRVAFGFEASWASGDNNLEYEASVPEDERDKVRMSTYLATADIGVHRGVDVGVGVGFVRFSDLPVDSFTRLAVQPVRVVWKPLVTFEAFESRYRQEFLQLRFVAFMFPDGFDAEDFGAIPGTFESSKEIQGSFSLVVDVLALIGK